MKKKNKERIKMIKKEYLNEALKKKRKKEPLILDML